MGDYERFGMWANLSAHVAEQRPGQVVVEATLTPEAHGTLEQEDGTVVVEARAVLAFFPE
jgi:hypothetical protein